MSRNRNKYVGFKWSKNRPENPLCTLRQWLIICLCLSIVGNTLAQATNIDSLAKSFIDVEDTDLDFYLELDTFKTELDNYLLYNRPDETYILALQQWATLNATKDPIGSIRSFEESIRLSEKLKFKKGQAIGLHEIGLLYFSQGLYQIALKISMMQANCTKIAKIGGRMVFQLSISAMCILSSSNSR
jgi:hypothetical protein